MIAIVIVNNIFDVTVTITIAITYIAIFDSDGIMDITSTSHIVD